jgi:hypothetical protein
MKKINISINATFRSELSFASPFNLKLVNGGFNSYSTKSKKIKDQVSNNLLITQSDEKLNPWYVTGFSDGESTFSVGVLEKNR